MTVALSDSFRVVLGPDRVRDDALDLSIVSRDASMLTGEVAVICWPRTTEEVAACVRTAVDHDVPFVARCSGTGLAGGATPVEGAVVICLTQMNRILEVDAVNRVAWVEPGVVNLDLSRHVARHGLHFAPDPSSQQSCSIGGNVANNSGGPHCLADGVTYAHILAVEVVLPDGAVTVLGGLDPEPVGLDLRGAGGGLRARRLPDRCGRRRSGRRRGRRDRAGSTVGGALALGHSGLRRRGLGPVRDCVLEAIVVEDRLDVDGLDVGCQLCLGRRGGRRARGRGGPRTRRSWLRCRCGSPRWSVRPNGEVGIMAPV